MNRQACSHEAGSRHHHRPVGEEERVQRGPEASPVHPGELGPAGSQIPVSQVLLRRNSSSKGAQHLGGRKETTSGPPEATAAPCLTAAPRPASWAWAWCPTEPVTARGPRGAGGSTGRGRAGPHRAGPCFIQGREQRAFTGCNPGRGEKNGQVCGEAGSHGGEEAAVRARLARGPGFRPLAAGEGPVCAPCQQGGLAF